MLREWEDGTEKLKSSGLVFHRQPISKCGGVNVFHQWLAIGAGGENILHFHRRSMARAGGENSFHRRPQTLLSPTTLGPVVKISVVVQDYIKESTANNFNFKSVL